MSQLRWKGPYVLKEYVATLLAMQSRDWPPSQAGVYVVALQSWSARPSREAQVLYVGASANLLDRIGNFMRDILGFYGGGGSRWTGAHSGAQKLWESCDKKGK